MKHTNQELSYAEALLYMLRHPDNVVESVSFNGKRDLWRFMGGTFQTSDNGESWHLHSSGPYSPCRYKTVPHKSDVESAASTLAYEINNPDRTDEAVTSALLLFANALMSKGSKRVEV